MNNHKTKARFFSPCLRHLGANKNDFNLYPWKAVYNTMREITYHTVVHEVSFPLT